MRSATVSCRTAPSPPGEVTGLLPSAGEAGRGAERCERYISYEPGLSIKHIITAMSGGGGQLGCGGNACTTRQGCKTKGARKKPAPGLRDDFPSAWFHCAATYMPVGGRCGGLRPPRSHCSACGGGAIGPSPGLLDAAGKEPGRVGKRNLPASPPRASHMSDLQR